MVLYDFFLDSPPGVEDDETSGIVLYDEIVLCQFVLYVNLNVVRYKSNTFICSS